MHLSQTVSTSSLGFAHHGDFIAVPRTKQGPFRCVEGYALSCMRPDGRHSQDKMDRRHVKSIRNTLAKLTNDMAIQQPQILERDIMDCFAVRQRRPHAAVDSGQARIVVGPLTGPLVQQQFEAAVSRGIAGYFIAPQGLIAFETDLGRCLFVLSDVNSTSPARPRLYDLNFAVVRVFLWVEMKVCGACLFRGRC